MLLGSGEWGHLRVTTNSRAEAGDVRWLMETMSLGTVKGGGLSRPDRAEPALDSTWGPREEILIPSPVACRGSAPRQRSKGTAGRRKAGNLAMARRTVKTEAATAPGRTGQGRCGQTTHTLRARGPQVHLCHLQNTDVAHSPAKTPWGPRLWVFILRQQDVFQPLLYPPPPLLDSKHTFTYKYLYLALWGLNLSSSAPCLICSTRDQEVRCPL